jgi:cold-inducible RNA-binding protein
MKKALTKSSIVYLSNLSYKRDRNGIRSLLQKFGTIKSITIISEPETKQSRGMAFVEMSSVAEAEEAINELNGKELDGRSLKANFGKPLPVEKKVTKPKKAEKDLEFKQKQLEKKARNDKKRKSNPFRQ